MRPLFLAAALLWLATLACSSGSLEASLLPTGSPAPDVTLTGMDDQAFALSSLRGQTLLVNFWFYH